MSTKKKTAEQEIPRRYHVPRARADRSNRLPGGAPRVPSSGLALRIGKEIVHVCLDEASQIAHAHPSGERIAPVTEKTQADTIPAQDVTA